MKIGRKIPKGYTLVELAGVVGSLLFLSVFGLLVFLLIKILWRYAFA